MEFTDKKIDLLIPKIINTLKIINDYNNNKLDNQTNISPIELITKKISLISIKNKDKIQKHSTPLKKKIEDDEHETGNGNENENAENENENKKYNLKKRFEEMKRRNNELYEDLKKGKKNIDNYNKNKNDFEKEINKLKIIFLNSKDVQDIKKKKNKINKLSGSFKLILTKVLQFKSYILKGEDIEKVINEKIEIIEKKFNEIKVEKNYKKKDLIIINNICRINNKIISTKLDELEHFIKLMNFNKNLYEKTQKEIEKFFDNYESDNNNIINEINIKNLGEINEIEDLENIIKKKYLIFNKKYENYIDKLEYIDQLDTYIQNEIKVNENINDNNLILWKRAINDKNNYIRRFLGYLGSELSLKYLIQTYIEINPKNDILRDISFKILSTEFATQKLYKISIKNKDSIKNFKNSTEKWFEYLEYLKKRIASMYNIAEIDICFFNHNHLNLEVNMLFFNKKNNNMKIIINKEVEIKSYKLLNSIILSNNIFDIKNSKNKNEWSRKKLYRGGINYYPPYGWIGIALKIKNKYEKYNDDLWLGKENIEGEWPVAYKGVDGNIFSIVLNIINNNFKIENNENNIKNKNVNNKVYENDIVLYPNINDAMNYAQFINFGKEKIQLKFVIMARVNPNKIGRLSNSIWFLNGNDKDIRPYRLLIKEQIYN